MTANASMKMTMTANVKENTQDRHTGHREEVPHQEEVPYSVRVKKRAKDRLSAHPEAEAGIMIMIVTAIAMTMTMIATE